MDVSLSLDRFEGPDKSIAVLVAEDGQTATIPRALLPDKAQPGDVVRLSLTLDPEAAAEIARQTKALQDRLNASDPGGDIQL